MSIAPLHQDQAGPNVRLLAQAIVCFGFVLAAIGVGWLAVAGFDWYAPAIVLIVAARFGYDHFFIGLEAGDDAEDDLGH